MSGVHAFMIPANTDVTLTSANANKNPGIIFKSSETTQRASQVLFSVGNLRPRIRTIIKSVIAPSEQRPKATPTGVRNSSPSLINMNEQPQTSPSAM